MRSSWAIAPSTTRSGATPHHFHPRLLFVVGPDDNISAALKLSRRRWIVAIVDTTSGAHARISTRDETRGSFNEAQWLQEDITNDDTGRPYRYPQLQTIRFRRLEVNSTRPTDAQLDPAWMSAGASVLAPTRLEDDGFSVKPGR
jgi:hypothetical protein